MSKSSTLVPEAKQGLARFKNEVAQELGVPFKEYNGDLTSRQCGSVGGEMVKRMVEEYEHRIKSESYGSKLNSKCVYVRNSIIIF